MSFLRGGIDAMREFKATETDRKGRVFQYTKEEILIKVTCNFNFFKIKSLADQGIRVGFDRLGIWEIGEGKLEFTDTEMAQFLADRLEVLIFGRPSCQARIWSVVSVETLVNQKHTKIQ